MPRDKKSQAVIAELISASDQFIESHVYTNRDLAAQELDRLLVEAYTLGKKESEKPLTWG